MLMAAVTSTSPGTDKANTWSASFERTESAGMSFAESFDEGSAVSGETPSHIAHPIKSMVPVENADSVPGKSLPMTTAVADSETRAGASNTSKMPNAPVQVQPSLSLATEKTGVPVASRTSSITAIALLQSGGKSDSGTDKAIQSEMLDGQTSPVSSGDPKNLAQKLVQVATDGSKLDNVDGTTDLDPEIAAQATPPLTGSHVKQVIANKSELPLADKSHDASSIKRVVTNGDLSGKKEKGIKARDKTEEKGAMSGSAVGLDVQTGAWTLAVVNPTGGQQAGAATASDADLLSPVLSATPGGDVGIKVAANSKNSKDAAGMEKPNGSGMKTSDASSTENVAPQKTDADATKAGVVAVDNPDGDKANTQRMATLVTDPGQLHAGAGTSGAMVSGVFGRALTQNDGATPHMTEVISHAVSTVQAGPNSSDTTISVDTGHKTLMVTPTSLEVGVSNGTHGWLKIRAEMADGGAINTSLSTASSSGQEMLHRELPSLTAYLQSEHIAVNAVVVQPAIAGGTDLRNSLGGSGGGEPRQAHQSDSQGSGNRQESTNSATVHAKVGPLYSSFDGPGGEEALSPVSYRGGGSWLNVRA